MHVIGTAGHVDHGKSTLVQRLTGIDPDRFDEEKRRGLTIDLGFAWMDLPSGVEVGIVDVPGHERFIRNMLAGTGGITICMFVVAATEGWMPQTQEHLSILDVLSVKAGVVALTKADLVSEDAISLLTSEIEERLTGTTLAGARVVPCSGVTGRGLQDLIAEIDRLVQGTPPAPDTGKARVWVDRVFTIAGAGTVVTGTLTGGRFTTGDEVEILPAERRGRIRSIQSHKKSVSELGPGSRCALNLAGVERRGAERGDAVVHPDRWRPTTLVDVKLRVLHHHRTGERIRIGERGAYLLYVGSAETPIRIKLLGEVRAESGEDAYAQLRLRDPLPLGRGDRFVIRDSGRILTVAGGTVLDPLASPARRKDAQRLGSLRSLEGADPVEALRALIETEGSIDRTEARLRTDALIEETEGVVALGDRGYSKAAVANLRGRLRRTLDAYHAAHPLESGAPREEVRRTLGLDTRSFDALVTAAEDVVEEATVVRSIEHRVALDPVQEQARKNLLERLDAAGFSPPLTPELSADPALIRALVESGQLVRIGDFYLSGRRAAEARRTVRHAIESSGPMTVAGIRDLLGTTRKYAVPLCEWLDSTGATVRRGDTRILGPNP